MSLKFFETFKTVRLSIELAATWWINLPATDWNYLYSYILNYQLQVESTAIYWTTSYKLSLQLYIELPATCWVYSYILNYQL